VLFPLPPPKNSNSSLTSGEGAELVDTDNGPAFLNSPGFIWAILGGTVLALLVLGLLLVVCRQASYSDAYRRSRYGYGTYMPVSLNDQSTGKAQSRRLARHADSSEVDEVVAARKKLRPSTARDVESGSPEKNPRTGEHDVIVSAKPGPGDGWTGVSTLYEPGVHEGTSPIYKPDDKGNASI